MEYFSIEKCKHILLTECNVRLINNKYIISKQTSQMAKKIDREPLWQSIKFYTNKLPENCIISERLYWIMYDICERPICKNKNCNNFVRYLDFGYGYTGFCSYKCRATDENQKILKEETCLKKYGAKYTMQLEEYKIENKKLWDLRTIEEIDKINQRRANTLEQEYGLGIKNSFQVPKNKEKARKTKKDKYGDEYYSNTPKRKKQLLKDMVLIIFQKIKIFKKRKKKHV